MGCNSSRETALPVLLRQNHPSSNTYLRELSQRDEKLMNVPNPSQSHRPLDPIEANGPSTCTVASTSSPALIVHNLGQWSLDAVEANGPSTRTMLSSKSPPLVVSKLRPSTSTMAMASTKSPPLLTLERGNAFLRKQLSNPSFIFDHCDTDCTGSLQRGELRQALRACALAKDADECLKDRERLGKQEFCRLVEQLKRSGDTTVDKRHVPHSLRGMSLLQLTAVEDLFTGQGWLKKQCEAHNALNAAAIEEGSVFRQCEDLHGLNAHVVTPMSQPGHCSARDHDVKGLIPQAASQSSFAELLNPDGSFLHFFVSHSWTHPFRKTMASLRSWASLKYHNFSLGSPDLTVYWICLFAINQHQVALEVSDSLLKGPFNAALAQAAGGAVMVVDEGMEPFQRIWCLFEVNQIAAMKKDLELINDEGPLSEQLVKAESESGQSLQRAVQSLWEVSAVHAKSSKDADKHRIWHAISPDFRKCPSHMFMMAMERDLIHPTAESFSDFDDVVHALLATPLLSACIRTGQLKLARECCLHGALFDQEQLNGLNLSTSEMAQVLHASARHGHRDCVVMLLQTSADASVKSKDGKTALIAASERGHEAVVKLLLDAGADVAETNQLERMKSAEDMSPSYLCQSMGPLLVEACSISQSLPEFMQATVMQLLGNGGCILLETVAEEGESEGGDSDHADVIQQCPSRDAVEKSPKCNSRSLPTVMQPLTSVSSGSHRSAGRQSQLSSRTTSIAPRQGPAHESVVKLLLNPGAGLAVNGCRGNTALTCAAWGGHAGVVKLLLDARACVEAATTDGASPLIGSALGGHHEAVGLLLQRGAAVNAADKDGTTSLMGAAWGGHEMTVRLLLQAGADVALTTSQGFDALMKASWAGHGEVVQQLLDSGADVAAVNSRGFTSLMLAVFGGHADVVQKLLDRGACPCDSTRDGVNSLMLAARGCHKSIVKLLLDADPLKLLEKAVDSQGCTALDIAAACGHVSIKELLDGGAPNKQIRQTNRRAVSAPLPMLQATLPASSVGADETKLQPMPLFTLKSAASLPPLCTSPEEPPLETLEARL